MMSFSRSLPQIAVEDDLHSHALDVALAIPSSRPMSFVALLRFWPLLTGMLYSSGEFLMGQDKELENSVASRKINSI